MWSQFLPLLLLFPRSQPDRLKRVASSRRAPLRVNHRCPPAGLVEWVQVCVAVASAKSSGLSSRHQLGSSSTFGPPLGVHMCPHAAPVSSSRGDSEAEVARPPPPHCVWAACEHSIMSPPLARQAVRSSVAPMEMQCIGPVLACLAQPSSISAN